MFPFCLPQVVLTNQITTHVGEKVHCPQWNQADGKNSLSSSVLESKLIFEENVFV